VSGSCSGYKTVTQAARSAAYLSTLADAALSSALAAVIERLEGASELDDDHVGEHGVEVRDGQVGLAAVTLGDKRHILCLSSLLSRGVSY